MRKVHRFAPLAVLLALGLGCMPAWARQADPRPHPAVTSVADGKAFGIADAKGHYLALHFLADCASPSAAMFVRDVVEKTPSVAGVRHVFVTAEPADQVKVWAAPFGGDAAVCIDAGGALALDLGLEVLSGAEARPATVVFDPEGEELFREVGTSTDDYLAFDRFVRLMSEKSRVEALADYNLPKGKTLAVEGYDIVAYFTKNRALEGKAEFASTYRGVTYRFATEEDRRLFAAEPTKYLPTYGGWCASAMGAKGTKVEIDPTNFKVKDGRLFLFYKSLFGDALKDWNKHEREWEPAADVNWKKLTKEDPITPPR